MIPVLTLVLAALPPSVDVSARVLSADNGSPVSGASVLVWDSSFAVDGVSFEPDGTAKIWSPVTKSTDAKGLASFPVPRRTDGFSSGKSLAVAVTAEGYAPFFGVFETANGKLPVGDVKLQRGYDLIVKLDCGASPCPEGINVQLWVDAPSLRNDVRNSSAGRGGVATFKGLHGGHAKVIVSFQRNAPGEREGAREFELASGKASEITIQAARTGADLELAGKVVDPLGKSGARVSAQCGSVIRAAEVAADGSFVIRDLPKGKCLLHASEDLPYLPPDRVRQVEYSVDAGARELVVTLPPKPAR